jgi:5-methylcytosine-specific restriction endonuclease McrA
MFILTPKKQCNKCGEWKPRADFYRDSAARDGLHGRCKECSVASRKAWAKNNPNKIKRYRKEDYGKHADNYKAKAKEWSETNPEWKRKTDRQWRENNKERKSISDKIYRLFHRDKDLHNARTREYHANNPEKTRAYNRRRRAVKLDAGGGGISAADERFLKSYTNGTCSYCGKKARLQIDHIVALTKGGRDDFDNAAPACETCNKKKGNRSLIVFLRELFG